MIVYPIEWLLTLIIGMCLALVLFTVYIVIERNKQTRRRRIAAAYLERNRTGLYEYLRNENVSEEDLVPVRSEEVDAIEELFRSLVHNVRGDGIEARISSFANRHLAATYRKRLRGRNWGKRMNALYHIHDFNIQALDGDCNSLAEKRVSSEEFFQLMKIKLKFNPDSFVSEDLHKLNNVSANGAKELLFSMDASHFAAALTKVDELGLPVLYSLVDVIGMKMGNQHVPTLERFYRSRNEELRIRVLRAYNTLGIVPDSAVIDSASNSGVWQERYQIARLLPSLPERSAMHLAERFVQDEVFLVRELARNFEVTGHLVDEVPEEAAADLESGESLETGDDKKGVYDR